MKKIIQRLGPARIHGLQIASTCGLFWFAWSFSCYQSVYLQQNGFTASKMGILNAISALVSIISVAFWGMISDRIGSIKKVLFIVLLFGTGLYACIPFIPTGFAYSTSLFLIFLPIINFFRGSMGTFNENMVVRSCNESHLNYGMIRAGGSFLFTIGSLIISAMLSSFLEVKYTFFIQFALFIPLIVLVTKLKDPVAKRPAKDSKDDDAPKQKINPMELFKNKRYVVFLIFTFIFYIGAHSEGAFIPFYMAEIGVDSEKYGILLAYRALLEIPFLLLMTRLSRKFKVQNLLMLGVVLMGVEALLFCVFANSLFTMILSTTFFGLGNGLFIGTSLNYVFELAPNNLKATAQSFFAATASISGILGNLLGGMVFDSIGAKLFYLVVFFFYIASVLVFFFSSRGKKKNSQEIPQKA